MKVRTIRTTPKFQDHPRNLSPLSFTKKSPSNSGETGCSFNNQTMMGTKLWNMETLSAALPLTPYSPSGDGSQTDFGRTSAEFYTPTYQDVQKSSSVFSNTNQQRERSKCFSVSTMYESATGIEVGVANQGNGNGQQKSKNYSPKSLSNSAATYEYESSVIVDGSNHEILCLLPPVPEEMIPWKGDNGTVITANRQSYENATPVVIGEDYRLNHRPKPYHEFLGEVQNHKRRAELDAARKEKYTHLLRKLRAKEAAIDAWESEQQRKIDNGLDKLEKKLEMKRAKAVKKTHKKLVETKLEAEKRKAVARRTILKEMSKRPEQHKS